MGLSWYIKVLTDVSKEGIDRLVLCDNNVLQQLTQTKFLCVPEKTLRENNRTVNMKIFISLKGIHVELPGLTILYFSLWLPR